VKTNRPHIDRSYRVPAFSVLEVTIVIALMALLGSLFFGALNRFNEQIANETRIKNELNDWYVVRANLWRELDEADSIRVSDNRAELFFPNPHSAGGVSKLAYFISDNRLFRKTEETDDKDMQIAMNAIALEERKGRRYVAFKIDWKQEEMILRFPLRSTVAGNVNHYFTENLWR
jgi:hypothetical protein